MGVFAYTRETFNKVLSDVRISYYTHRLNAQALWSIDNSLFPSKDEMNEEAANLASTAKWVQSEINITSNQTQQNSSSNDYENIDKKEVESITFKFWLESIKETIFAYTLPIFHIIKLPIFLTVAAFSEVFNGLKSDFNFFFKRNKNNTQDNMDNSDNEGVELNNRRISSDDSNESEAKDYSVNARIEDYFKPQLITVDFSRVSNAKWDGVIDFSRGNLGLNLDINSLKKQTNQKTFKI